MHVDATSDGRILLLRPDDDLDAAVLPDFARKLSKYLDAGARFVVVDLSAVRILQSTAVGFLIDTRRRLLACDGKLVLAAASETVRRTLSTLGVDLFFRVYPTAAEATAALA
jgi:anti-sigma B factor antagonist